jgi:SlyX protein
MAPYNDAPQPREPHMNEERLIEIETRIAFQEETIKTLSDVMYEQQKKIDKLTNLYTSLAKEKEDKKQGKPEDGEGDLIHEKPPHY